MSDKPLTDSRSNLMVLVLALILGLVSTAGVGAREVPSSELLLPYFEVDLEGGGKNTLFSVVNTSSAPVKVRMSVYSNWGVEVHSTDTTLNAEELRTVDLSDWLIRGELPEARLDAGELEHCQAAVTGQRSANDDLYYASEVGFRLAVGSVKIRTLGGKPVLFGDYNILEADASVQADVLVDIADAGALCERHALRFIDGSEFDEDTEILIWSARRNTASGNPYFPSDLKATADFLAFQKDGGELENRRLELLPIEVVRVSDLVLDARSGWFAVDTGEATFISVRHRSEPRLSVALRTFCLPTLDEPQPLGTPAVAIETSINGRDADQVPGPVLPLGITVPWEYRIENTGDTRLDEIAVSDLEGAVDCPRSALASGESMTCRSETVTAVGLHRQLGHVTALAGEKRLDSSDLGHYFGDAGEDAAIDLESAINGLDADVAPGLEIIEGGSVHRTYEITNTGAVELSELVLTDDDPHGNISCPRTSLGAGESMICDAYSPAFLGLHRIFATVTATTPRHDTVRDSDAAHYRGKSRDLPRIAFEASINGRDADAAPGLELDAGTAVTWTYLVYNLGNVPLEQIAVGDDHGATISCPATALNPGQSMTCTAHGTAGAGQYSHRGAVAALSIAGHELAASDFTHYVGR